MQSNKSRWTGKTRTGTTRGAFGVGLLATVLAIGLAVVWPLEPMTPDRGRTHQAATNPIETDRVAQTESEARILRLQEQLALAESTLEPWDAWYRQLKVADTTDGVGPTFLRPAQADTALVESRWLDFRPRDGEEPLGPYSTLVDVARQLEELGIDFLVVPVPAVSTIYPRQYLDGAPAGETIPPYLDWRLRRLYLALEEQGVEVLDLVPAFLEPPDEPPPSFEAQQPVETPVSSIELLFRAQDRHWTARGSDLAARVVAERLRRYPWFEEVSRSMGQATVEDRWILRHLLGPIARRLIQAGVLPPDHPPEAYLQRKSRIEGEKWNLDDQTSPILLMGDSFSNTSHGFVDALLVELGFRLDLITVQGGNASSQLSVLRLRDGGLEGKRLVVWQVSAAAFALGWRWRPVPNLGSAGPVAEVADRPPESPNLQEARPPSGTNR